MALGNLEIFGFPTSEVGKPGGYYSTQPYNEDGSIPWPRVPRPDWQSPDWVRFPAGSAGGNMPGGPVLVSEVNAQLGSQAALTQNAANVNQESGLMPIVLLGLIAMVLLKH